MASNPRKDAYERYINGLDNPIGSVMEFDESVGRGRNKYASDLLDRHAGQFSSDNPLLKQLAVATNKQDIDALYEQAINWETNNSILQEQREYNLPENEIARQRDAGINPDLTGSGSGSGGIGSGNAEMNPVQGQTKFSNSYDNIDRVLAGVNTAAGSVSSFAGAYSSIIQSLSSLKLVPSQIKLNEANARLGNSQANEIDKLLDGRVKGQGIVNAGMAIQNSQNVLSHLAGLSRLLSADSSDETILSSIKGLGLSDDEATLGSYKDIVKAFHSNPEMQEKYYSDVVGLRKSKEVEEQFDEKTVAELVTFDKRIARAQRSWDANVAELQSRVSRMLNNNDYATDLADLEQSLTGNANVAADIQGQMLQAEFDSLALKLDEIALAADDVQRMIDDIEKDPDGTFLNKGELTDIQKQRIASLKLQKARLLASGAEKFEECFDIIDEINRQTATYNTYYESDGINKGGVIQPSANVTTYNQETYMGLYERRRRPGEVVTELGKAAITALSIYAGAKASRLSGQTTIIQGTSSKGQYFDEFTNKTNVTYTY